MQPSTRTIYEYFKDFAGSRPECTFIFDERERYTAEQAFKVICSAAAHLAAAGVGRGVPVAVRTERTVHTVLSFFALQFVGARAVLFDPRDGITGFDFIVEGDTLSAHGESICLLSPSHGAFLPVAESFTPTMSIFTSGSTGVPKRVDLSQYNFVNNSLDTQYIGGYIPEDINIDIVPIHHVFGLALIFTAVVLRHGIYVPQSVTPDCIIDGIIRHGVTRLNGVPSLYLAMAEHERAPQITSLRCGLIGGAPCTAEQFSFIESRTGITLIPVYGMSECIGISCADVNDPAEKRRATVGRVYSMNEVSIAPDGEILVKSPAMAAGAAEGDGWLHTGDLGVIDAQGFLSVCGRKKDIIIRNGNNLSSVAIERKVLSLPRVRDVCVVGLPDRREGEVPAALIVLKEGDDGAGLQDALAGVLLKNELPARVIFASSVPLTSSCKPDKQAVRAMFCN